ncbi:GHMP kinase, partial [Mycena galopus ATCC 62051]
LSRTELLSALSALIREIHEYLVTLGVSHASVETIRATTAAAPYGVSTKLTGAGGGGCAVTLLPDDFEAETLDKLIAELEHETFVPYVTSVGGSGLGILSPYTPPNLGQASHSVILQGK